MLNKTTAFGIGAVLTTTLLLTGCSSTGTAPSAQAGLSSSSSVIADTSITDPLGTYTSVKWNDPKEYSQLNANEIKYLAQLNEGYTEQDILSAKQFVLNWMGGQMIDSSVLDNPDAEGTFREFATSYVNERGFDEMLDPSSGLVFRLPNGLKTVRDSSPRITNAVFTEIFAGVNSEPIVSGTADVSYRLTEESVVAWYKGLHPEMADKDIRSKLGLTPGTPVVLQMKMAPTYWVEKQADGSWKIHGYASTYTPVSLNGKTDVISELQTVR